MKSYLLEKIMIWELIGIILFKIALDYSYVIFVAAYFEYMGFTLDFQLIKYFESWIAYLILFLALRRLKDHVLYMTLLISFLLIITPTITLYALKNETAYSFYGMMLPYLAMLLVITAKKVQLYYIPYGKEIAISISLLMVGIVLYHFYITVGIKNINFSFSDVYELRASPEAIASYAGIFGYLNHWTVKVFNAFLISVALLHRRYLLALVFIAVQVMFFAFSGHKAVLFSVALVIGLYIFDKLKHHAILIIYSMVGIVSLMLLYHYLVHDYMLPSILIRRAFFVPTDLNYIYFDYFSSYDYLYWSNSSVLKDYFITYPYDRPSSFVIGDYMGFPDLAANTGIFGSGYMHFGLIGIIIYMALFAIYVNLVQQFSRLPEWQVNSIVLIPILAALTSADLPTSFFTHGLIVALVIIYLYSSPATNIETKKE
jgi:hypothetical protein